MYDYGVEENRRRYGSTRPLDYPLEHVTNEDMYWMTADNDWMSQSKDLQLLRTRIGGNLYVMSNYDKN